MEKRTHRMEKYTIQEIIDQRILVEFDTTEQAKLLAEEACKLRGCKNDIAQTLWGSPKYIRLFPHDIGLVNVCALDTLMLAKYENLGIIHFNDVILPKTKETFNPQPHYDNIKGSLYKVANERGWNAYLFDIVKRLERGGKKDPLKQEIEKSIDVLKIWLNEL